MISIPSSNKTPHLSLNKWSGPDKPKKDDFNTDNQKIDEAIQELVYNAGVLTATVEAADLSGLQALSEHVENADIHVTQEEKNAWSNGPAMVIGTYTGNGAALREITVGYKPRFGVVFSAGDGVGRVVWGTEQYMGNTGFLSEFGSTFGLELTATGFTARFTAAGGPDGFTIKFNANSVTYIYVLWK